MIYSKTFIFNRSKLVKCITKTTFIIREQIDCRVLVLYKQNLICRDKKI